MRPWIVALATLFVAGSAMAQPAPPTSEDVNRAFRETDRNGDGRIDREEFHRRTVEVFYLLDANRDGYLVVSEVTMIPIEAFRAADRDGDGKLSLQEYVNARFKDFEAMDTNRDGSVSKEELERYTRGHAPAR